MRLMRGARRGELVLAAIVVAGMIFVAFLGRGGDEAGTDTYATTDFRSGGYAAFFLLMQREDVHAVPFERRPVELDASIDTLVVAYPPGGADGSARLAPDREALKHWVSAGGRLVALGTADPFAEIAPLKNAFSLPEKIDAGPPRVKAYGHGELVLVPDARRFDNANLAKGDNARAAYALAQPRHAGGIVAFDETVHGALVDRRWWQTLDESQLVILGGIALAALIALAGGALRLGPALSLRETREPASDEFVAAVAALYQRSRARRAAIALLAHGARHATGEAAAALRALAERQTPNDRDLIASAQLARTIREAR